MTSVPSPKDSKQQPIGSTFRRGYERIKSAINPPSPSSAPIFGSAGVMQLHLSPEISRPENSNEIVLGVTGTPEPSTALASRPSGNKPRKPSGISRLETALRVLEKSAGVLPPFKSVIGEFVACLDIEAAASVKDYEELTAELAELTATLNQYRHELGSYDPDGAVVRISLSIKAEVERVEELRGCSTGMRIIQAHEKEEIVDSYRRIERLFRQLHGDIGLRTWKNTDKQRVTTLLQGLAPVDDARYNSSYSTTIKRRGCTAETREQVQADLQAWVETPDGPQIYWMNGMAGTGKTTIAYSFCEWLEANHQLGASFFCSRISASCRNVNSIVPSIAYQLARRSPVFRSALCAILEADPDASKLNVVKQFEKLIRDPISTSKDTMPTDLIVVIDALDECEDDYGVRLVLGTLLKFGADLPVRFFVTSRPEPAIRDNMLSSGRYSPTILHLHDIEQSIVEEDVKKYLAEALSVMSPPPSDQQIARLTKRAGKLFIYAATVVRYILPGRGAANATSRLNAMLAPDLQLNGKDRARKQYRQLDELYTTILASAFDDDELEEMEMENMRLVLRTVVCAKEPMAIPALATFLDIPDDQILSALQPLRSVLHVSDPGGIVSTLHASFPDYMLDHSRSREFYCTPDGHSEFMAHRCFGIMKDQLRFNICGLISSFVFDKDVPDLDQRIQASISSSLFYSCQYWGEHILSSGSSKLLSEDLGDFLSHRLLFWMEVLNLKQCIILGVPALACAARWLLANKHSAIVRKQAVDSRDFITRFAASACSRSTPHIYISALPFCAKSSTVYAHYWKRTQMLMDVHGAAINQRNRAAQATWVTKSRVLSVVISPDGTRIASGSVDGNIDIRDARTGDIHAVADPSVEEVNLAHSVVFSPDGTCIASGSSDHVIRLWDSRTGNLVSDPFWGHTGPVHSVAYSSNGIFIGSGSADMSIRVWDAHTGHLTIGPLIGHTDSVNSVAFSPDSTRIVSGSTDKTIRVWDLRKGSTAIGPFEGHTGSVNSVAFSPDGGYIVSCSDDKTIRMWDASASIPTERGLFRGHTKPVSFVAFAPDGQRIASCSRDSTIRIWDILTGTTVAGPFEGHTHSVSSVAFSPDGTQIVSCSGDKTIRIWYADSNDSVDGMTHGHKDWVTSVVFSPDASRIASGSDDHTLRLWDANTGSADYTLLEGHTHGINSVAFSSDGTLIASGSSDKTVRVWDVGTGELIIAPLAGHTRRVNSVAFAPDNLTIASGSGDLTIRVWNLHTGDVITDPFTGHTSWVNSVVFSPDGTRIVSGSLDHTIRVWDLRTGETIIGPFIGHLGSVNAVSFSPDGRRIVSGSDDKTIRVWDAQTGITVAEPFVGHIDAVNSVAFSPDGLRIVSGSTDIRVWDVRTGNTIGCPFNGHTHRVMSTVFSPDGTRIASGSYDHTIRVADVRLHLNDAVSSCEHIGFARSITQDYAGTISSLDNNRDIPLTSIQSYSGASSDSPNNHPGIEFRIHDDGWVRIGSTPLFWVPLDLRTNLPHPYDLFVIGTQGSLTIDYRSLALGERWTNCYNLS